MVTKIGFTNYDSHFCSAAVVWVIQDFRPGMVNPLPTGITEEIE